MPRGKRVLLALLLALLLAFAWWTLGTGAAGRLQQGIEGMQWDRARYALQASVSVV